MTKVTDLIDNDEQPHLSIQTTKLDRRMDRFKLRLSRFVPVTVHTYSRVPIYGGIPGGKSHLIGWITHVHPFAVFRGRTRALTPRAITRQVRRLGPAIVVDGETAWPD